MSVRLKVIYQNYASDQLLNLSHLGPVAPISVNFNHQLAYFADHSRYNSRASSTNGSSVKSVSQLTVQLTELGATGPK